MKKIIALSSLILVLFSCNNKQENTNSTENKTTEKNISKEGESIFNLTSKWNTEEGKQIELKDLKGKVLVMVMIYTTCKAACPRLVADMQNISKQIPANKKNDI